MNFFSKKKNKYKEITDFTQLENVNNTLYIYTTGILDQKIIKL